MYQYTDVLYLPGLLYVALYVPALLGGTLCVYYCVVLYRHTALCPFGVMLEKVDLQSNYPPCDNIELKGNQWIKTLHDLNGLMRLMLILSERLGDTCISTEPLVKILVIS